MEAFDTAMRNNLPVYAIACWNGCPACDQYKKMVLNQDKFQEFLSKQKLVVIYGGKQGEWIHLKRMYFGMSTARYVQETEKMKRSFKASRQTKYETVKNYKDPDSTKSDGTVYGKFLMNKGDGVYEYQTQKYKDEIFGTAKRPYAPGFVGYEDKGVTTYFGGNRFVVVPDMVGGNYTKLRDFIKRKNYKCKVDDFYKAKMVYLLNSLNYWSTKDKPTEQEIAYLNYIDGEYGYNSASNTGTTKVETAETREVNKFTLGNIGHDCTVVTSDGYTFRWVDQKNVFEEVSAPQ